MTFPVGTKVFISLSSKYRVQGLGDSKERLVGEVKDLNYNPPNFDDGAYTMQIFWAGDDTNNYWYRDQDVELLPKSTTTFKDLL